MTSARSAKLLIFCGCIILGLGLLLFAYLGLYNRLWADDYCYNADFQSMGMLKTLQGYTWITTYASNRFSLTLFSGLLYYLNVYGVQMMTGATVLLAAAGMYWNMANVNKLFNRPVPNAVLLLCSSTVVYYTFYFAPNQYQILYWRTGLFTYTAALVFGLYIFGLITHRMSSAEPGRLALLGVVPLAFLGGGFSEAGGAFLAAALVVLTVGSWYAARKGHGWGEKGFPVAGLALICVILAIGVMFFSPANQLRLQKPIETAGPLALAGKSAEFTWDFVRLSLLGLRLPHAVFIGGGIATTIVMTFFKPIPDAPAPGRTGVLALATIVVTFLLIAAIHAPNVFVEGAPPPDRALMLARFTLLLGLAILSWLAGWTLASRWPSHLLLVSAAVLLLGSYVYVVRSITITLAQVPRFTQRARVWDQRDAALRTAAAQGRESIDVQAIDSLYIGHIVELKPIPTFWVNGCAENYYGIKEIKATIPP